MKQLKRFNQLKNETIKAFFEGRYSSQVTEMEEIHKNFKQLQVKIEKLNTIAKEQSSTEADFEKEVADAKKQLENLTSSETSKQMKVQLEAAQNEFYNVKEEIEKRRRQDEVRLAPVKKEEERKAADEEKAKADPTNPDDNDEAYPWNSQKLLQTDIRLNTVGTLRELNSISNTMKSPKNMVGDFIIHQAQI